MDGQDEIQGQEANQDEANQQAAGGTNQQTIADETGMQVPEPVTENPAESETKKVIQELHAKIESLEGKMKAEVEALYTLLTKHGIHHAPEPVADDAGEAGTADEAETKAAE